MAITLRNARNEDFEQLHRIYAQVHSLHVKNLPNIFVDADALSEEYFSQLMSDKSVIFRVASIEGKVVGFHICIIKEPSVVPIMQKRRVVSIESLGVLQEERGKGIGSRLMKDALAVAKKKGADDVSLNVYAFNENAKKLYEKFGFKTLSERMEVKLNG